MIDEPSINFSTGMFETSWTFVFPDGTRETRRSANRAYLPHELTALLRAAGFIDVSIYGSIAGEAFGRLSKRCIVVGQRPMRR